MFSVDHSAPDDGAAREKWMLAMLDALAGSLCQEVSRPLAALIGALEAAAIEAPEQAARPKGGLAVAGATASALRARLGLVRAAWAGGGGALDLAAFRAMAAGLPSQFRPRLETAALPAGTVFPPPLAWVMLNVLMLADEALPAGGTIHLSGDPATELMVLVEGPHAAWPPGLAACLADPEAVAAEFAAGQHVQAPMTVLTARVAGVQIALLFGPPGLPAPLLVRPAPPPP